MKMFKVDQVVRRKQQAYAAEFSRRLALKIEAFPGFVSRVEEDYCIVGVAPLELRSELAKMREEIEREMENWNFYE